MWHYIDILEANEEKEKEATEEQEEDKGGDDGAAEAILACSMGIMYAIRMSL